MFNRYAVEVANLSKYQFLVLAALLLRPMHPYAIRQEVIALTDHKVWPAESTVRRAIDFLKATGLIEECHSNAEVWLVARKGVPYEVSDKGYWVVRRELAMYHRIFSQSWKQLEKFDE